MQMTVIRSCAQNDSPLQTENLVEVSSGGHVTKARNRGANVAVSDWLLFVDEDCTLLPEQYDRIQNILLKENLDTNCIWGVNYARQRVGSLWGRAYNWIQRSWVRLSGEMRGTRPSVENLLGGFLLIHRHVFSDLGGFSEKIPWGGEETEFLRRAKKKGYQARLLDEFEIKHQKNLNFGGFLRRAWYQGYARGLWDLKTSNISLFDIWRRRGELDRLTFFEFLACLLFGAIMIFASSIAKVEKRLHD